MMARVPDGRVLPGINLHKHLLSQLEECPECETPMVACEPGDYICCWCRDAHETIREILKDHYRSQFYDSEHTCGHGRKVRYWRPGDWYHQDDGSLCMDGPKYKSALTP